MTEQRKSSKGKERPGFDITQEIDWLLSQLNCLKHHTDVAEQLGVLNKSHRTEIDDVVTTVENLYETKREQASQHEIRKINEGKGRPRWRFVIHAGIDGYSRRLVYINCSTDNRADTVLQLFKKAVDYHGLSSRVRGDRGVENVEVARYMISHPQRGPGRGSYIGGKSVHNQRIERHWKDVYYGCTSMYYDLFCYLEKKLLLELNNHSHMWALQFVYLPRINKALQIFKDGWNAHPISTEHNRSPNQLWILGMDKGIYQDVIDIDDYGIDNDISSDGIDSTVKLVVVPELEVPLNQTEMDSLCSLVDPLAKSDSYGIDLFLAVLDYIDGLSENYAM